MQHADVDEAADSTEDSGNSPKKGKERPLILLTNDDGVRASGLIALAEAMAELGEVWVVAPASEQSAVSSKITLWEPVRIEKHGERRYAVTGTPADSVYIATTHLLDRKPDLCISGINHGANLGDDVIYSGTVAGAIEATLSDIPSIAISLAARRIESFDNACLVARRMAERVLERGLPRGVFLNVNVPKDADGEAPMSLTKLGRRHYMRTVSEKKDPRGRNYYWIGGSELGFDDMPGSDCNGISHGKVTVSPIHLDLTHYHFMREMGDWDEFRSSYDDLSYTAVALAAPTSNWHDQCRLQE